MTGRTDVRAALLGGKTFRSLSEQRLSPREEKFERARQTLGFFLAPAAAVTFVLLPVPMDRTQQLLATVLLGVIILWICEPVPIPVGGLLGVAAVVILGVASLPRRCSSTASHSGSRSPSSPSRAWPPPPTA